MTNSKEYQGLEKVASYLGVSMSTLHRIRLDASLGFPVKIQNYQNKNRVLFKSSLVKE